MGVHNSSPDLLRDYAKEPDKEDNRHRYFKADDFGAYEELMEVETLMALPGMPE